MGKKMIDCLILGDSIAVGTHQFRPECVAYARGGWNSRQWNRDYLHKDLSAKTVIISLGSNDHENIRTVWELQQLRSKVQAERVFWIMPAVKPEVQDMIRVVAQAHKDMIITIPNLQRDGVHPSWAGYKKIVEQTR
jgi:lysophospholipase L1-like esterase